MVPTAAQPIGLRGAALAMLTVVLWGCNPVAVRYSLDQLPPLTTAGIRFGLASLTMAVWCWMAHAGSRRDLGKNQHHQLDQQTSPFSLSRDQLTPVVVCGLLLYAQIGLFTIGCDWTNASHTSLIVNSFALGVVLIEHFVTRAERLTTTQGVGVLMAVAGVPLVFIAAAGGQAGKEPPTVHGDVVLLGSAALLAVKVVYTKRAVARVPVGTLIFWHDVIGALLLAATALVFEQIDEGPWGWPCIVALAYQGILVAGLCFGIQAYLLSRHAASDVTVFNFATPLVGVAAGIALRGEQFSKWLGLAGVLVATGIFVVNRGK